MKGVDQLQRLEAAILAAKRVGAEALDPESYSAASELRERLAHAFRVRFHQCSSTPPRRDCSI